MDCKSLGQTVNSHLGIGKVAQGKPFWPLANLTDALGGVYTAKHDAFLQEDFEVECNTFKKKMDELASSFITGLASKQADEQDFSGLESVAIDGEDRVKAAKSLRSNAEMKSHGHQYGRRAGVSKDVIEEFAKGVYTLSAPTSESETLEGSWNRSKIGGSTSFTKKKLHKTLPMESLSFPTTGSGRKQNVNHRESPEQIWEYAFTSEPAPVLLTGNHAFAWQSFCGLPALAKPSVGAGNITPEKFPVRQSKKPSLATVKMQKIDGLRKTPQRQVCKSKELEANWKQTLQTVRVVKQLLSGGFAGVISRTAVAPLDLIKTYLITSHGLRGSKKSALTICRDILERDGWQGLFRGNLVNCIRIAPSKAIELCVFETVRRALNKEDNPLKHMAATIAGGAAGMAGTIATYPLELIRTRISVQPELYSGLAQAIRKIAQDEGFLAFYSGLSPSLVGVFPYAATNYFVYDGLRVAYLHSTGEKNVPTLATLTFGAVAAAASSAVTYPLEVARRQMQLSLSEAFVKRSTVGVILDIYQHEGFLALYRGLGTTWLKLIPAAGISFVCYETARLALQIDDASLVKPESPIMAEQEG